MLFSDVLRGIPRPPIPCLIFHPLCRAFVLHLTILSFFTFFTFLPTPCFFSYVRPYILFPPRSSLVSSVRKKTEASKEMMEKRRKCRGRKESPFRSRFSLRRAIHLPNPLFAPSHFTSVLARPMVGGAAGKLGQHIRNTGVGRGDYCGGFIPVNQRGELSGNNKVRRVI